ncbi:MAG: RnfABCDGE type electron transport complex subunit G [Desulfobacter sp.]
MREMISMVVVLTFLTAVSGGLLAAVKSGTQLRIEEQVLKYQQAPAINEIFADVTNDPIGERFNVSTEGISLQVFPGKLEDGATAVAFETKGKGGYGGDIGLMIGINTDNDQIIAARVTTHSETPGLGSRVKDETTFVSQYSDKSLNENFDLKNNDGSIDAISGATITSQAVANAAVLAQDLYKKLKPEILKQIQ